MKKKYRGLLALLMALAMVLTACGGKGKPAEEPAGEGSEDGAIAASLSVQVEEAWLPYYEAAAARVKESNPEAEINFIQVGSFEHLDVLDQTDATNEDVADLFAIPADRVYGLADNELLAGIDSQKLAGEIGGWDNFDDGIGGNFKVGEEYLAFPYNIETLITFVNTANAEAEGIDYTQPLEIADMEKAETVLLPLFDCWYGVSATNSAQIELLGKADDGSLFSDMTAEWADLDADKQAALTTIYDYWKKHNDAATPLFDNESGWAYVDETFATGGAGVARIGGPWDTNSISEKAGEGNLAIYPLGHITLNGKPLTHWQGGWGLAMNARIEEDAAKVALAEAMIKEIVNPEFAVDLFKATGKVLENVGADVYAASDLSDTDKKVIEAVISSYAEAPARPLFTEWGNVWDSWKNAVLSWNAVNPADAQAAYAELKASFDAMMANF